MLGALEQFLRSKIIILITIIYLIFFYIRGVFADVRQNYYERFWKNKRTAPCP